jgi:hypothetical protein
MEGMKTIFSQIFNINNKEITGTIKSDRTDRFLILYQDGKEIKRAVYTGSLDDLEMITELERLIEE